ncbi:hypothetical protein [Reyranella sp.]|uniref:hypothetical protein n=1 Tax=Reyranella sp. TaxID=1929291 RepID=UPI004036D2AC
MSFSIWLWPPAPPIPQQQTLEDYSAFAKALDPECFSILQKPSGASPYQQDECADKDAIQRKGYRDLAQSIRASNAAEEAVWLSYLQTRAAVVGAAFLVLTLAATAWAAWAAADAAQIAGKSAVASFRAADAADRAIAVASDTAQRQLRAYLSVEPDENVEASFLSGRLVLGLKTVNRGQTPAYRVNQWLDFQIGPSPLVESPFKVSRQILRDRKSERPPFTPSDIAPGDHLSFGINTGRQVSSADQQLIAKGLLRIYVVGKVYYRDAFKCRRYSQFCFALTFYNRRIAMDAATDGGNRSN